MRTVVSMYLLAICTLAGCATTTPASHLAGRETFETHCASCHGALGEGDGPVAATLRGQVPNLRTLAARNGGEFPADRAASYIDGRSMPDVHGGRAMPVWGPVFDATDQLFRGGESAEERIASVVAYLRELQQP